MAKPLKQSIPCKSCTVKPRNNEPHVYNEFLGITKDIFRASNTVEPRSTDNRLIRTPALYGQFRLSRQKAHIFSLKLTRFIIPLLCHFPI